MERTLLKHVSRLENFITTGNTKTMGVLPRWNQIVGTNIVNYEPVVLKRNKNFPGFYVIQNGRHRIAKLYLQGKKNVKARIV
jgi:hypothetical protein